MLKQSGEDPASWSTGAGAGDAEVMFYSHLKLECWQILIMKMSEISELLL